MLTNTGPRCWSGVLLREGVWEGSHAVHESEAVPGAVTQAHWCRILAYFPCRAGSLHPSFSNRADAGAVVRQASIDCL